MTKYILIVVVVVVVFLFLKKKKDASAVLTPKYAMDSLHNFLNNPPQPVLPSNAPGAVAVFVTGPQPSQNAVESFDNFMQTNTIIS